MEQCPQGVSQCPPLLLEDPPLFSERGGSSLEQGMKEAPQRLS